MEQPGRGAVPRCRFSFNRNTMTAIEIQELIHNNKWTELLCCLEPGENELFFPSEKAMKSCKAMAYDMNSRNKANGLQRGYYFHVEKVANDACRVIITVK